MQKKEPKEPNLDLMEKRLVNFRIICDEVILKWSQKYRDSVVDSDRYIYNHIIEILLMPDLKVAAKKLNARIMAVHVPLLRSYYKEAREDLRRMRKVQGDHKKFLKAKERKEERDRQRAERADIRAREKAAGVLPAKRSNAKRTQRTLEIVPGKEVNSN
jgi:hypothetical protein